MNDVDFDLSMRISRRGKADSEELRSLLVHRLRDTKKAVLRASLRDDRFSIYCEPCDKWTYADEVEWDEELDCPHCGRVYELEFSVYSEKA